MTVISRGVPRQRGAVAAAWLAVIGVGVLAACSSTNRSVQGSVGVSTGVSLTTPGSVTQIQVGTTIVVSASVINDVNNQGVTWSMTGAGSLTGATSTSVTYNAPASATGAVDATITATSVANTTAVAAVTLISLGTPVMEQAQLFPANVNVPYGAPIVVAGGEADYTWVLASNSGALPPGLTLNGSTSAITSISGTPTAAGTYSFTVQATDALNRVASQTLTLVVRAQSTCLLTGTYTFMVSGFRGGGPMTHIGSITVDSLGNITGEQDYKDGHRTTTQEALISGSACTNRETNSGSFILNAPSGPMQYDFSVTPPDSNGNLNSARLELIGSGSDSASGQMTRLDTGAITATPPSGDFAYGLLTVANQEPDTVHTGSAGRFTASAAGNLTAGLTDSNASPALTAAPLSGTISAPDAMGRGTATLSAGGQTSTYAYYLISPTRMYLMNIDATVGSLRSTGFMSAQVGNAAGGAFDNGALAGGPGIINLWGAIGNGIEPINVMTIGRLYDGDAAAGTLNALLDYSDRSSNVANINYSAQPYSVDASGRATLALTFQGSTRQFVLYLDGTADGYVIEQGALSGNAGTLEAQYVPSGGVYPDTLTGFFVGGTQFAQSPGPIVLIPTITLNFGDLSSTFTSGQFAVDPTSSRGFGSLTLSGIAAQSSVIYQVSPTRIDLMTFGTIAVDPTITWLTQN